MKVTRLGLAGKILSINGIILFLVATALSYIFVEINRGTAVIEKQAATLERLRTANAISTRFENLRYWLADFAVSWLNESEEQAQNTRQELETLFLELEKTDAALAASLRPKVNDFVTMMTKSVEAYIDDNRVLGNSLVADGRRHAAEIEAQLNGLLATAQASAKQAGETVIAGNTRARNVSLLLMALTVAVGGVVAWSLARAITKPLGHMAHAANKIAVGDLDQNIAYRSNDELGVLANAFRLLIDYIQGVAHAAEALSRGDLSAKVTPRSDQDVLSKNFMAAIQSLQGLVDETRALIKAAQEGKLSERGNAGKFQGAYRDLIDGINQTLEAVIAPINEAAAVLEQLAKRDLATRMKCEYKGDFARIKAALNTAAENLDEGLTQVLAAAQQVSSASAQISAGSQSLAQDASQQASSLEEVSSSLHEMASMTKQNTGNVKEASGSSEGARASAERGENSMKRLAEAIAKIKSSSDATAKIVKTIDEIAFQTNLLALNAAVEAARAGDAGKGFAVVAEEVRNLAMRSAEAAKSTAQKIEESVKSADGVVVISNEVLENFDEINAQIRKVGEVMAEIAAASEQQSHGIDQVNASAEQMSQLTQQTAANAQESAATAEELSGQAEEMKSMVASFKLTQAAPDQIAQVRSLGRYSPTSSQPQTKATPVTVVEPARGNERGRAAKTDPKRIIPLDEKRMDVLEEF